MYTTIINEKEAMNLIERNEKSMLEHLKEIKGREK